MDFSSCINFDEVEEKVLVVKPKIIIRKTSIYREVVGKQKTYEKYSERSKSYYYGRPIINYPVFNKVKKSGNRSKGELGDSDFDSKNVIMTNLAYCYLPDEKSISSPGCTENIRKNNKNVRRVKWQRVKLRSKSCISPELDLTKTEKFIRATIKKQVLIRPKLKSKYKANFFNQKKEARPELRILGVSKDFELK